MSIAISETIETLSSKIEDLLLHQELPPHLQELDSTLGDGGLLPQVYSYGSHRHRRNYLRERMKKKRVGEVLEISVAEGLFGAIRKLLCNALPAQINLDLTKIEEVARNLIDKGADLLWDLVPVPFKNDITKALFDWGFGIARDLLLKIVSEVLQDLIDLYQTTRDELCTLDAGEAPASPLIKESDLEPLWAA